VNQRTQLLMWWPRAARSRPRPRPAVVRAARGGAAAPLEQDPDVSNHGFSSGLWPFSTLGLPMRGPTATWYATACWYRLDSIFFWCADDEAAGPAQPGQAMKTKKKA